MCILFILYVVISVDNVDKSVDNPRYSSFSAVISYILCFYPQIFYAILWINDTACITLHKLTFSTGKMAVLLSLHCSSGHRRKPPRPANPVW